MVRSLLVNDHPKSQLTENPGRWPALMTWLPPIRAAACELECVVQLQIDRSGAPLEARFIEHLAPLLRIGSKVSPAFEEQQ